MKEIIGEYVENVLADAGCTANLVYKGKQGFWYNFSVWEIDDDNYDRLLNYTDNTSSEDWLNKYNREWWRYSEGCNLGDICTTVKIRDNIIKGWYNSEKQCNKVFDSILDYFCSFGASTESNVSALSTDIAKANNISIAELYSMYGEQE